MILVYDTSCCAHNYVTSSYNSWSGKCRTFNFYAINWFCHKNVNVKTANNLGARFVLYGVWYCNCVMGIHWTNLYTFEKLIIVWVYLQLILPGLFSVRNTLTMFAFKLMSFLILPPSSTLLYFNQCLSVILTRTFVVQLFLSLTA